MDKIPGGTPETIDVVRAFPQDVHDSLNELRTIARAAKSKDDPRLRWATADELALARTQHKSGMCTGHSSRTGLPCETAPIRGLSVCRLHGGAAKHAKRAAERRLREAIPEVQKVMLALATQKESPATAQKAAADILDRAGVGAVVRAKVRASKRQDAPSAAVVVNIGFLG